MKKVLCHLSVLLGVCILGCQQQHPPLAAPVIPSKPAEPADKSDACHDQTIEIADVLDALDLQVWKIRVNGPGDQPVSKISLCSKLKDGDPTTELSIKLNEKQQGPATLVVTLRGGAINPSGAMGRWYKAGLSYLGEDGRSYRSSNLIADPIVNSAENILPSSGRATAKPGITLLRSSNPIGADFESHKDTMGIYLKFE